MNKRSAMLMAAGLVLTLIVGGVAMSIGLTGPTSSEATPRAERRRTAAPIVKTVKHTVTVHKRGSAAPATGTGTSGSNSPGSVAGSTDDDHGSDDDDDVHGEDHGDHGSDDSDDHGDDHGDHGGHGGDDHGDDDQDHDVHGDDDRTAS
ncbi:MAG TPA: hypothetical protein VIX62_04065 [Actinomycetota bacterium]